jgi:ABC-type cobalt transport system, periplasmic component
MSKNAKLVILLLIIAAIIAAAPLLMLKGATFGGSDDAGSQMVNQIEGNDYTPWFTPVLENIIGGEVPGEVESLMFCLQTGLGCSVLFFFIGRFYERKKQENARAEAMKREEEK